VADLRSQYVLGFAPDASGAAGQLRKISVKVSGHGKVVVRHRVAYRLPVKHRAFGSRVDGKQQT
jgi:hypothetical protein